MPARKHKFKPDEEPGQRLRVMATMDCRPGNRRIPDCPPITILALGRDRAVKRSDRDDEDDDDPAEAWKKC